MPCENNVPDNEEDPLALFHQASAAREWTEEDRLRAVAADRAEIVAHLTAEAKAAAQRDLFAAPPPETVHHPRHYNLGDIEHCEIVEDQGYADGYYAGQITKYAFRAGHKGDKLEDLKKLAWYAARWAQWTEHGKAIWNIQRKP